MIIDSLFEFSVAQTCAVAASTVLSTNQIDLGAAKLGIGEGKVVFLTIDVDTAIVTGGSAGTIQFLLVSDTSASISTTVPSIHLYTGKFVTDDDPTIPAGTLLYCGGIPSCVSPVSYALTTLVPVTTHSPGGMYERYLGVEFIVATTTITAGKFNARLSYDPHGWKAYAQATVSA